jgi:CRISPR-associated endonuclease/helicase Cas3
MSSLLLRIQPVYSEYYHLDYQIGSTRLLTHQVATWKAILDPDVDVVFNTAMTGDGKSLAAYLPAFQDRKHIIAMYPTNELIQDQHAALPNYEQRLKIQMPANALMYGAEITRLMSEHGTKVRLEEVRSLLSRHAILLTNPDLVHLMMSYQYGWDYLRKELPTTIGAYFDYFLFDEFHVFGVPQVIAVMNMLGYLHVGYRDKPNERKKFVFLSATPSKLMNGLLERGGLRYRRIEGHYRSTNKDGYRCILQGCDLHLDEASQEKPIEAWIEERLEDIHQFFRAHIDSKAAILVYSVATARRIYERCKDYFEPLGITVGENTGLTNKDDRKDSYNKHILVGTTTVDIGVDFHINYLIFEAWNAGSFLQRFGRLGRHAGYGMYEAHALIPRFVLERLQKHFGVEDEVERETFNLAIREAFPTEQEFEQYARRWGVVQAAQVVESLKSMSKQDENSAFTGALVEQYEQLYGSPEKPVMQKASKKYWRLRHDYAPIIEELSSFRGQSPLSCGVWDSDDHLKSYDLFFLLANTEYSVMQKEEFLQEVRRRGLDERDYKEQLLYLRVWRYVPERMQLVLGLQLRLADSPDAMHKALATDGFFVKEPHATWLDVVNRHIKRLSLTCILSDFGRNELKQKFNLGGVFPIYRLQDKTGQEYSVAFGQEALLLDTLLFFRKTNEDRPMML